MGKYLSSKEIFDILNNQDLTKYDDAVCTTKVEPINAVLNYDDACCEGFSLKGNEKCPHCGESYYMELSSYSTAMYFPPIYKDGVNINPDRNISTTECKCLNCGKLFSYKS